MASLKFSAKRQQWENSTRSLTLSIKGKKAIKDNWGFTQFIATDIKALSFGWYGLARMYEDTLYVNSYKYSPTIAKHITLLKRKLSELNMSYDMLRVPKGMQDKAAFLEAVCPYLAPQNDGDDPQDVYEVARDSEPDEDWLRASA